MIVRRRSRTTVAVVVVVSLLGLGVSSASHFAAASMPPPTTSTGAAAAPAVGVETESASIFVTVAGTRRQAGTDFCNQAPDTDFCEAFDPATADVIYVDTTVRNETSEALDLTCSYEIDHALIDDQDRALEDTGALYEIEGNPGCNDQLNPGFSVAMSYTYPIPTGHAFIAWRYYNPNVDNAPIVEIPLSE
jgi:hypothetical protein